ncbi:MAG: TPR repeat-containing protein YrrB [Deltaproteobacteria bacterium ADurb.BinA179]|nr:tetratricopeptide repeat protein [Deltaproteobacteria bacterium]OPZ25857.1 MAG: TPR repeat-containing protein YrrB [Deltaproteobacteria bacterium ADurb.BinA179]HNZ34923.1 tetratricopeptide repeat protein [Syntrophales bacterium]HOH45120.1 tetratricopeptide repeat protein [Syntrophales bacterium]HPV54067.1 tetratricopeptide repeat protein [Syntrophales bacterium]
MPARGRFTEMRNQSLRLVLLSGLLAVVTIALYWPAQSFDFVNYDDDVFVKDNRHIRDGLSGDGLVWAFTTFHGGNWHPLTWLSHMADVEVYGLDAGGHHRTNALIHTVGALLLFLVLAGMTNSISLSVLVAALFAIHPLHVESVAWIAERKDVLSGFFWILTMGAYAWYARHPTVRRYLLVVLSFIMGLLSKPMVVTLPFVLILLDFWPLQRTLGARTAFDGWTFYETVSRRVWARLVLEKMPLFLLSAGFSLLTFVAQKEVGAVWSIDKMPIDVRLANALVSYVEYLRKTVWPVDLAVLYPHAGMPDAWKIAVSAVFLGSVSVLTVRKMRAMPFLLVGWLWYLGTLVPVIGIVQVGSQSMADRYTYIPLVGLFIILAWGAERMVFRCPGAKRPAVILSLFILSGLLVSARSQIGTWKNSVTLFEQCLAATPLNPLAHHKLGEFYMDRNDCGRAVPHFLKAIEMKDNFPCAYHGLGVCASRQTPSSGAFYFFRQALLFDPQLARTLVSRGILLIRLGRYAEAEQDFRRLLQIDPSHEAAHVNLGLIFTESGKLADAEAHLIEALRVNPRSAEALNNLGLIRFGQDRREEAVECFQRALALSPREKVFEANLRHALAHGGR